MDTIVTTRQRISTVYLILELNRGNYVDCVAFSNLKKLVKYMNEKELCDNSYNSVLRYMHKDGFFRVDIEEITYRVVGKKVK